MLFMSWSTAIICCNCNNIECLPKERQILVRFNTEVGGLITSWKGFNCCEWDGVECSNRTSHVTQLRLSNLVLQNLSAIHTLPPLFELKQLEYLDISSNGFTGAIPAGISALKELKHLDMSNNFFEGEIPLLLGNLSNLQYLNIAMPRKNEFKCWSSLEWARNLPKLQYLSMKHVAVTSSGKELGEFISSLHNLHFLEMRNCKLSDPIPTAILNLTSLTHLILRGNKFSSPLPPWLVNMTNLQWLNFHDCNLTGPFPLILSILPHLQFLRMDSNNLSGNITEILGSGWPELSSISLSGPRISGRIPPSIGSISSLTNISLEGSKISGQIPASLGNLRLLENLSLQNNSLTGTIPSSLTQLSKLKHLDLSFNQLTGNLPSQLDGFLSLRTLFLESNKLNGTIPKSLGDLLRVQRIDLGFNLLQGRFSLQVFQNTSSLTRLRLSHNQLTAGMVQVGSSKVQSNNGTASYYKEEVSVTNKETELVYVDSILLLVTCIDLSGNQLSGIIPSTIGALFGLVILNISRNNLSGEIPQTFVKLEQIESLDLSYNKLEGKIPVEMQVLHFLAVFIVSNNRLSGKIPTGGQFSTFNVAYFYGNPSLCGFPLDVRCAGSPGIIPIDKNENDKVEEGTEAPWYWYISCMATFAIGFWGVFALVCARRTLRRRYINMLDEAVVSFSSLITMH
ncbi:hypothetical protein SUGI_0853290 [Cryptomeria japonica]|nr:hypothetical protein SUGI_0853290 [Cryptomeria japonica]